MADKFTVRFDGRYKMLSNDRIPSKSLELVSRVELGATSIKCNLVMNDTEFHVGKSFALYQITKKNYAYNDIKTIFAFAEHANCNIVLHMYKGELWFSYFKFSKKTMNDKFLCRIARGKNVDLDRLVRIVNRNYYYCANYDVLEDMEYEDEDLARRHNLVIVTDTRKKSGLNPSGEENKNLENVGEREKVNSVELADGSSTMCQKPVDHNGEYDNFIRCDEAEKRTAKKPKASFDKEEDTSEIDIVNRSENFVKYMIINGSIILACEHYPTP